MNAADIPMLLRHFMNPLNLLKSRYSCSFRSKPIGFCPTEMKSKHKLMIACMHKTMKSYKLTLSKKRTETGRESEGKSLKIFVLLLNSNDVY
jgi:hypothetical protein